MSDDKCDFVERATQMNTKLIVFSSIVTALVGTGIGFVLANMFPSPYTGKLYQDLDQKYELIGAATGLLLGGSQEALRQLKKQRDEEEVRQIREKRIVR
jgi:flagellar motor component MotA